MKKALDYLILLIRSAITGEKLEFSDEISSQFDKIMRLARLHEIAHLAAFSLINNQLLHDDKQIEIARKFIFDNAYTDTKNTHTYSLATEVLNKAGIPFVPLKGVIIKKLYPEGWMRSSCDIDILIHKSDIKKAIARFEHNGFTLSGNLNFHDVALLYDNTKLELHFSVCENIKNMDRVLQNVWDYTVKTGKYEYLETNDFFAFHHIAHMAYHFLSGGCGIRPFLDLWLLKRSNFFDGDAVHKLCEKAKIDKFYVCAMQMIEVWFEGKEHTDITKRIEKYILVGGAYGYYPNNAAAYTIKKGGRFLYLLSLAFPDYSSMRALYPILNKSPFLLPFCYFYRFFEKTIGKNNQSAKQRYKVIKEQDGDFIRQVATLLKSLELDK